MWKTWSWNNISQKGNGKNQRLWQSSQTLDHTLKTQKSQSDKSGIDFSPSAKDNTRSYADILCSNPKEYFLIKVPIQIQRMNKEKLQGRRFIQIIAIITGTKLSFLDNVIIVEILVIKLNIAWLVRIKYQDWRIK